MKLLQKLFDRYYRRKVIRYTDDLCEHMANVYGYFKSANHNFSRGDMVKEAVSTIGTWERVSENVFKHKFRGDLIEIKPGSHPIDTAKKVLQVEVVNLLPAAKESLQNDLVAVALAELERYYAANPMG